MDFRRTPKQVEIIRRVTAAIDAGAAITLHELHAAVSWKATKQALQCSLNFLEQHGFIRKEHRGNRSMLIYPTMRAYEVFRGTAGD